MGQVAFEYASHYTIAEWENWQDQWELIHGQPYCMSPAPNMNHQRVSKRITRELDKDLDKCGKCESFLPIDWQISEDTVVQPDISIVCKDLNGKRLHSAPMAIFEVLSLSTKKKDRTTKFNLYESQRVTYYVLVDPDDESVEFYRLNSEGKYEKQDSGSVLRFDFEGCEVVLDMGKVW